MSGIEEVKKKAKISLDEMYEDQSDGKLESQKSGQPAVQQSRQTTNQPSNNTANQMDSQTTNNPVGQPEKFVKKGDVKESIEKAINPENHTSRNLEIQESGKPDMSSFYKYRNDFPVKQAQDQKAAIYKMTFNLTEEVYKAFNDLYAKRILQGRKTEKSDMICEALDWLVKMEQHTGNT